MLSALDVTLLLLVASIVAVLLLRAFNMPAVLLVVLLRFGPPLMQGWVLRVARQRSHEPFTLNILLAALLCSPGSPSRPGCRWSWVRSSPAC
jgi:hypothetical protein